MCPPSPRSASVPFFFLRDFSLVFPISNFYPSYVRVETLSEWKYLMCGTCPTDLFPPVKALPESLLKDIPLSFLVAAPNWFETRKEEKNGKTKKLLLISFLWVENFH